MDDSKVTNSSPDSGKTAETITAGEFTSGDNPVCWAWSAGQCKVFHGIREVEYSIEDEIKLFDLSPIKFPKDEVLQVRWLTPQPAPASEQETAGSEAEVLHLLNYKFDDGTVVAEMEIDTFEGIQAYVKNLQAENSALASQLATAEDEMQALRTALEFYSSFDYEYIPLDEDKGKRAQVALAASKPLSADADEGG